MNAQRNAPISDRFSSLSARVFSPAAAIFESEKTLGTRLRSVCKVFVKIVNFVFMNSGKSVINVAYPKRHTSHISS